MLRLVAEEAWREGFRNSKCVTLPMKDMWEASATRKALGDKKHLEKALLEEWEVSHEERCTNMANCESFGGDVKCYYPKPEALGEKK